MHTHTHPHTHTESHLHMQSLALYSSKTGRHRHKHTNKSFAYSATMTSIFSLCNMTCLARCTSEKASLCPTTQVSVFSHIKPVLFSTGSNKSPVKTATMRVKFSGYSVSRWTVSATIPCSLCRYAVDLLVEEQLCASQVGQVHHHQQILWRGKRQNSSCWHPVKKKTYTCIQKIHYSTPKKFFVSVPHLKPWCSPNVRWEDSKYNHFTHVHNQKKVILSSV